jgi:hypothetical protein
MDPHIAELQAAIARSITNPPACSSALDEACDAAWTGLSCAANPARQAFFRQLLRNMRLREQVRAMDLAAEADALLGAAGLDVPHTQDAARALLQDALVALGMEGHT